MALEDVTASIPTGRLTGIIGSVGCGKSTLLSLLLNELDIESGKVAKFNTFGFASQEAWIISGTIRDNILLGRDFDEKRYNEVVDAACLRADLAMLEFGDETLIGDRGVTLSGGQSQASKLNTFLFLEFQ